MDPFANDDVLLLVFDLGEGFGETADYMIPKTPLSTLNTQPSPAAAGRKILILTLYFQRITLILRLRHVHNPMHVERHLLRVRRPAFITKAVRIPAIAGRGERVVVRRHRLSRVLAVI